MRLFLGLICKVLFQMLSFPAWALKIVSILSDSFTLTNTVKVYVQIKFVLIEVI